MRARFTVEGDFAGVVEEETRDLSRDFRDGVDRASAGLHEDLRSQTASALRGRGVANAWRRRVYPLNPFTVTLHPAAVVWTRAPNIVSAFEEGKPITAHRGRFLAFPTSFNATSGRRNAGNRGGVRVTVEEMRAAKGQAVVIPSKRDRGTKLWCLRVREGRGTNRRQRGRVRLYVGGKNVEVLTGRIRAGARAEKAKDLLSLGLVPMYFLKRTVNPGKRLDVAGASRRAEARLVGEVT